VAASAGRNETTAMRDPNRDTPLLTAADSCAMPAADGPACLVSIYGPHLGKRWCLERSEATIGRDAGCDVSLPIDTVSRRHCRVEVRGAEVTVTDLGSTNGTAINDEPVAANHPVALRSGDRVRVGSAILKFLRGDDVESLYHEEIYRTMVVDGLTGVSNRRFLTEFLDREMARCRRHDRPLALVLFDLDHFKQVNDGHGHLTGDDVLRTVAEIAREHVRREDCLARFGGDEFAVVLTETDSMAARLFAERLRGTIEVHEFRAGADRVPVTISSGVATMTPAMRTSDDFLAAADARLYEAKSAGRNRTAG
jgi:diguanylate cyclase (GGDEF)-like protein